MNKHKTLAILTLLAVLPAGAVLAQTVRSAGDAPSRLDANGDGVVDRAEAAGFPRLAAKFDELDKNKDGKLDKGELPRRHAGLQHDFGPGHPRARWIKLDADKDGRISRAEAKADPKFAERFDALDADKDGFIDRADFQARLQQRRDAWFAKADADKDGKLSKAEFDAARGGMVGRMRHGPEGHGHQPSTKP